MTKKQLFIACLIFPFILLAQDELPVTQNIRVEVLTGELQKNSKVQKLNVNISCDVASPGQKYILQLRGVESLLIPVQAQRDEETLWLIKSGAATDNNIVLAWDSINEVQLQLAPGSWPAPYSLQLEIRVSLSNLIEVPDITGTQLDVRVLDGGTESQAAPEGRGNQISLKNSRE